MAEIPLQVLSLGGTILTEGAAAAGDTAQLGADKILVVENNSGATITVTLVVPGNDFTGNPKPDMAVAVPAAKTVCIPLKNVIDYADAALNGQVAVNYSATASVVRSVISNF